MNYQKFSLVFGFSLWFLASLPFVFWGDLFFRIDNNILLVSYFIGVIPILYFLSKMIFNRFKLSRENRLRSAVLMALPGMFCDVLCIKFHAVIFPKLSLEQTIVLGAWVIWVYAIAIILGLIVKGKTA